MLVNKDKVVSCDRPNTHVPQSGTFRQTQRERTQKVIKYVIVSYDLPICHLFVQTHTHPFPTNIKKEQPNLSPMA